MLFIPISTDTDQPEFGSKEWLKHERAKSLLAAREEATRLYCLEAAMGM
jgi:hypothetical protein